MRDTRSLLLLLLSVGLIGTWIYHLYDKTQYSHRRTEVYIKDSAAIAQGIHDSLDKIYSTASSEADHRVAFSETNTDSLKTALTIKLNELNQLKTEIKDILKKNAVSRNGLMLANQKIEELKQKVNSLQGENTLFKEETGTLRIILQELNSEVEILQQNVSQLNEENKELSEKMTRSSFFLASEMSLNAIAVRKQKENETFQAKKTSKLVASFLVQNPLYDFNDAEVIAVVIQPDGRILKNNDELSSSPEPGNAEVPDYTKKIHFNYIKGERRKIIFSLHPDKPQKGNYQLQIWHKGVMIGKIVKTLS